MDYLVEHKLIKADTRVNLLGNRLVLIAPDDSKLGNVTIDHGFDIAKLAGDGRIAIGDVKAVPAGLYAKAALENSAPGRGGAEAGAWPKTCAPRSPSWRAARRRSASSMRPTPRSNPRSRSSASFPTAPIRRSSIRWRSTATSKNAAAERYLDFLRSRAAKAIFEKYGFSFLVQPMS